PGQGCNALPVRNQARDHQAWYQYRHNRSVLWPRSASRQGRPVDQDDPGQRLVHLFPHLRTAAGGVRRQLEAWRFRGDRSLRWARTPVNWVRSTLNHRSPATTLAVYASALFNDQPGARRPRDAMAPARAPKGSCLNLTLIPKTA